MSKLTSLTMLLTVSLTLFAPSSARDSVKALRMRYNQNKILGRQEAPVDPAITVTSSVIVSSTVTPEEAVVSAPPAEVPSGAATPPEASPLPTSPANDGSEAMDAGRNKTYTQSEMYTGKDFLDTSKWTFFTGPDPTKGVSRYVSSEIAQQKNLAVVDESGTFILKADDEGPATESPVDPTKPDSPKKMMRDSVRIHSVNAYDEGLVVARFDAMPWGCSVWPAYWSHGPDWPMNGEIDLLENVHNSPQNQYTLHTGPDCSSDPSVKQDIIGDFSTVTDCDVKTEGKGNSGCAIKDTDPASYGEGFTKAGGGVVAHIMDRNGGGLKIWRFSPDQIPEDIQSGSKELNPATWGKPLAYFPDNTCKTASHFNKQNLILNIAICGDWASPTFAKYGCAKPDAMTCEDMALKPENYKNAVWKVKSISVYQ